MCQILSGSEGLEDNEDGLHEKLSQMNIKDAGEKTTKTAKTTTTKTISRTKKAAPSEDEDVPATPQPLSVQQLVSQSSKYSTAAFKSLHQSLPSDWVICVPRGQGIMWVSRAQAGKSPVVVKVPLKTHPALSDYLGLNSLKLDDEPTTNDSSSSDSSDTESKSTKEASEWENEKDESIDTLIPTGASESDDEDDEKVGAHREDVLLETELGSLVTATQRIIELSNITAKKRVVTNKQKQKWWDNRKTLDNKMKEVVQKMEEDVLGWRKAILVAPPADKGMRHALVDAASSLADDLRDDDNSTEDVTMQVEDEEEEEEEKEEKEEKPEEEEEEEEEEEVKPRATRSRAKTTTTTKTTTKTTAKTATKTASKTASKTTKSTTKSTTTKTTKTTKAPATKKKTLPSPTSSSPIDLSLLEVCLGAEPFLSDSQIEAALTVIVGKPMNNKWVQAFRAAYDKCAGALASTSKDKMEPVQRQTLMLALDGKLQRLPWESLTMLEGQSVTRVPSLLFAGILHSASSSRLKNGIDAKKAFYLLNSEGDLVKTQECFEVPFKRRAGWQGIVGSRPSVDEYKKALIEHDLFVYCGHGSSEQYLQRDIVAKLPRCSTALLMGCSSGHLRYEGDFEPNGMATSFLLALSPAVVGNLWDVTDGELDRLTKALLDHWLDRGLSLPRALAIARGSCQFKYLVAAAAVCYGIPIRVR